MLASATQSGVLTIQDERFSGDEMLPYAGRRALVPVLLGLAIPAVSVAVVAPQLLSHPELVFGFYLMTIFVVSAVIFVRSVFNPGSIVTATFDASSRTASFVRIGSFSTEVQTVLFSEIERVHIESQFDDDGYKTYTPLVDLKSAASVQLPEGTTQGQINSIRALVGC